MTNTNIKTININSVFGKPKADDMNKVAFTVFGVATSSFSNMTKHGESIGLKGDFSAVNAKTGEIFTANACFLNRILTAEIVKKLNGGLAEVEFSADIKIMESNKNDKGYAYIAEECVTKERENRQAAILLRAQNAQKLLLGDK